MKKKYIVYVIAPVFVLGLMGAGVASAHGGMWGLGGGAILPEEIATRQTAMFQNQANLLGVTVDEVKNAWAQGKTMRTLAEEKGITDAQLQEKMKAQRDTKMREHLQALVSQGVITQAQADQRLSFMNTQTANGKGMFGRGGHRGMGGMGMRF